MHQKLINFFQIFDSGLLLLLCLRFDVFPTSAYNEVFSGYQPGQMVER